MLGPGVGDPVGFSLGLIVGEPLGSRVMVGENVG